MSDVQRTDEIQGEILHVYDGIEEADNNLPTWWLLTFYGAIAFGLVYWFYYQVYGVGVSQKEKYAAQVAAAEAERTIVSNESLDALALDATAVAAGSEIFTAQCIACHDMQGQGREGLGPNLTDKYWIHGGDPVNIHETITNGIAAKGMPAWAPILGEEGVNQVVAYVITLRDTNVEGKGPEGEVWVPGGGGADTGARAEPADDGAAAPTDPTEKTGPTGAIDTPAGSQKAEVTQ